jgi:aldehyde dehydrogenase (NAD+)
MPSQTGSLHTAEILSDLRRVFDTGRTRGLSWRLDQLRGIERLCDERDRDSRRRSNFAGCMGFDERFSS